MGIIVQGAAGPLQPQEKIAPTQKTKIGLSFIAISHALMQLCEKHSITFEKQNELRASRQQELNKTLEKNYNLQAGHITDQWKYPLIIATIFTVGGFLGTLQGISREQAFIRTLCEKVVPNTFDSLLKAGQAGWHEGPKAIIDGKISRDTSFRDQMVQSGNAPQQKQQELHQTVQQLSKSEESIVQSL